MQYNEMFHKIFRRTKRMDDKISTATHFVSGLGGINIRNFSWLSDYRRTEIKNMKWILSIF